MFGLTRASKTVPPVETFDGQSWRGNEAHASHDTIASETAVALVYNGMPYVVMMATPENIEDFVLGFSLSEGIIGEARELSAVRVVLQKDGIEVNAEIAAPCFHALSRKQRNLTGRLGCGLCGAQTLAQAVRHPPPVAGNARFTHKAVQQAMAGLAARQPLHAATGAMHAAAWLRAEGVGDSAIALVREDVGRHNALDKLIGAMVRDKFDFTAGAALITSRASYEMIQKAATVGIPMICAVSAPTSLAIRMAQAAGVTLVAFARGDRHTVYAHPERITDVAPAVA